MQTQKRWRSLYQLLLCSPWPCFRSMFFVLFLFSWTSRKWSTFGSCTTSAQSYCWPTALPIQSYTPLWVTNSDNASKTFWNLTGSIFARRLGVLWTLLSPIEYLCHKTWYQTQTVKRTCSETAPALSCVVQGSACFQLNTKYHTAFYAGKEKLPSYGSVRECHRSEYLSLTTIEPSEWMKQISSSLTSDECLSVKGNVKDCMEEKGLGRE